MLPSGRLTLVAQFIFFMQEFLWYTLGKRCLINNKYQLKFNKNLAFGQVQPSNAQCIFFILRYYEILAWSVSKKCCELSLRSKWLMLCYSRCVGLNNEHRKDVAYQRNARNPVNFRRDTKNVCNKKLGVDTLQLSGLMYSIN